MNDRPHLSTPGKHTRREFLKRGAMITAGAGLASPWLLDLARLGAASPTGGYRATVCLFLYGGNDHYDTFIPTDATSHAAYVAARGALARPADEALGLSPRGGWASSRRVGFAAEMPNLHRLFHSGQLAVLSNIGTLTQPLSKAGYEDRSKRPPQLFSHNDQQSYWQASSPEGARTGWSGRTADLLLDGNGASSMFTSITVSGNAVLMTGNEALQYQISSRGVTQLTSRPFYVDEPRDESGVLPAGAIRRVLELSPSGLFGSSYSSLARRALDASDRLSGALATVEARHGAALDALFTPPEGSDGRLGRLLSQFGMVARLIAAGRASDLLDLDRQVFFVSMGGFDNHSDLVDAHRPLVSAIDTALSRFYEATSAIGAARDVTSFTGSDFGRTLAGNGDGSDHGWGAHHLVMGGSVAGRRIIGDLPVLGDDARDDVGRGRLLPQWSVDQLAASLATWMGVSPGDLGLVAPNIGRYATNDLGLFRTAVRREIESVDVPAPRDLARATRIG